MATFLQLANRVIRRINEVEITTVASQRGIYAFVLDSINDSIKQINYGEVEWPFNYVTVETNTVGGQREYNIASAATTVNWDSFFLSPTEQVTNGNFTSNISSWTDLDTGTGASTYVSTGNGRLNLNGGASGVAKVTQAITTVTNKTYEVKVRVFGGTTYVRLGTTSDGTDVAEDQALEVTNLNRGQFYHFTFVAESATTYITFYNAVNASHQVDTVSVKEKVSPTKLKYVDSDIYEWALREIEERKLPDSYTRPIYVYPTNNQEFGLIPTPDTDDYVITYESWQYPAALTVDADTTNIPAAFDNVIVDGALYLCYLFKQDFEQAGIAKRAFDNGLAFMRTQLTNRPTDMKGTTYGIHKRYNRGRWTIQEV